MNKAVGTILILGALAAAMPRDAAAQEALSHAAGKPGPGELAAFFDEAVPELMERFHVVGTVVGVGDGSGVLFLRGYGSADLEKGTAVDPETTLFAAGSITKLFTWTGLMQLVEQGLLRLEDPVEEYLDFPLPGAFEEPIRIVDLMNHTPGFEDRLIGLMVKEDRRRQNLGDSVRQNVPRRVRPPGQEASYSNYGTMLAGYIIERLSGMPYEEYVRRNILQPLGMERSSLNQPPPPDLAADLAVPYTYRAGIHVREKPELLNGAPAGALVTTAPDMLRFYRAYLNGGELEGRRILEERTVRRMQQPSFRHDPRAGGFAHGFFEIWHGELRGFGHGGDTIYFHSDSGYLPSPGLAYFVSTNTATGMQLTLELQKRLLGRFFPVPTGQELASKAGLDPDLEEYTGFFAMNRRSESDPTQVMGAMTLIRPKVSDDGEGLFVASILDPEGSVYVPVEPEIFQAREGSMRLVFLRDERGRVRSLYSHEFPAFLFSRPPLLEHPAASIAVLIVAVLLLLSAAVAPPTGLLTLIRRLRPAAAATRASEGGSSRTGFVRLLALWSGRGYLLLVAAQVAVVASLGNLVFAPLGAVHAIPLYLAAAAAAAMLVALVFVWRSGLFRRLGRVHYTAFTLSQALLLAWLGHWGFFFV